MTTTHFTHRTRPFHPIWLLILVLLSSPSRGDVFAYVANGHSGSVSVINTKTNVVDYELRFGATTNPIRLAVAPDGRRLFVSLNAENRVAVISTQTNLLEASVLVGERPGGLSVAPDGARVYVTNIASDSVSVIDSLTNAVVASVSVGEAPRAVAVTPDGEFAYVTNLRSHDVTVIDTTTNMVVATVPVGDNPDAVAITPDGALAYVANSASNTVSVIDTVTNVVEHSVPVDGPVAVAVTPNGARVYVVSDGSESVVSVIDSTTNVVVATVPAGANPSAVAITPDGALAYVANSSSHDVSVIDTTTNMVVANVPVGSFPRGVAITPAPINIEQTFSDVANDFWAVSFIEMLVDSGIAEGCGGNNYCPERSVSRADMAIFLERGLHGVDFVPTAATGNVFMDVSSDDFAADFIEQLYLDGITAGCGANNYCPSNLVTRAQIAVFLLRVIHGPGYLPPPATGAIFNDVDAGYWAAAWIEQLAAEDITSGCGRGNYCPDDPVTRAQMAVFLARAFDL